MVILWAPTVTRCADICASLAVSSAGGAVPAAVVVFVLDRAVLLPIR